MAKWGQAARGTHHHSWLGKRLTARWLWMLLLPLLLPLLLWRSLLLLLLLLLRWWQRQLCRHGRALQAAGREQTQACTVLKKCRRVSPPGPGPRWQAALQAATPIHRNRSIPPRAHSPQAARARRRACHNQLGELPCATQPSGCGRAAWRGQGAPQPQQRRLHWRKQHRRMGRCCDAAPAAVQAGAV